MPVKSPEVLSAKLRPPRLLRAIARERLFAWIDARRASAAIWLSGAPGSGKTTLIASYLRARGLRSLWYRFDPDDTDAARFYATLGQAVDAMRAGVERPAFAAEHLQRPREFARRWFLAVCAGLSKPVVFVFDNVEQAAMPALNAVIAEAIDEAPAGVSFLITCRHAPDATFGPALLSGSLCELPAAELRFDALEVATYAREFDLDPALVERAARRVQGWAAGLRLLSHAPDPSQGGELVSPQRLFDYFAGLSHDSLRPATQHALLIGALLPWMPATLLATLTNVPEVGSELERLCFVNLFVEPVAGMSGVYRLHPLFQEFLLERGRQTLAPGVRSAAQAAAARAFGRLGQVDIAIDLLLDAGEYAAAQALLVEVLELKLALGQLDQWSAWAKRLPLSLAEWHPGVLYGLARVAFLREDMAALQHYERALASFAAADDLHGQQLCAAGALEWGYNTDSFADHQRWCNLLRTSDARVTQPVVEEHRWRLLNGELLATFFLGDFERYAPRLVGAVLDHLVPGAAENDKLSSAITLLGCLERHKRWDDAALLAGRMEAMLSSPRVGARLRVLVTQQIAADLYRQTGAFDEARRLSTLARSEAKQIGFASVEFEAIAVLLLVALYVGDEQEGRRLLRDLDPLTDPASVYHQRFAAQVRAWLALQVGRATVAMEHAQALRSAVAHSDMPEGFRATWLLMAVFARFACGDEAGACAELAQLCRAAETGSRATLNINLLALKAWAARRDGDAAAAAALTRRAFAAAKEIRYYQLLQPFRAMLAQLAALALEDDQCAAFARELILRRRLSPPEAVPTTWPWAFEVRTLGHFSVCADGELLKFDRKTPRKPLALLKAIVAFGPGPVAEETLADALWPDDEADAAQDAMNVALHRLRKMLPRGTDAVRLQDGKLSLDADLVWVDAVALGRRLPQAPGAGALDVERVKEALALYRGHFLASDAAEPWSVSARERLRARVQGAVAHCAEMLGESGRHEESLALFRHGLEIDDLDERFYQGVMREAIALARPSEGIAAYQRLKRSLSILMGLAPSLASEALARTLMSL